MSELSIDMFRITAIKNTLSTPRAMAVFLLCIAFSFLLSTLTAPLMTWVIVLSGCAVVVRLAGLQPSYNLPTSRTVNLLAILAVFALTWFGFSIGLLDSMINLLTVACALKVMLVDEKRDFHLLICASLFLIGCGFISSLSVFAWFGYTALVALLLCSTAIYHGAMLSIKTSITFVAVLILQSLPIALLLFLLLPQLPPLWQMPTSKSTETGLSDTVTPGDIASLATSSELAFSATFEDTATVPVAADRYWRALTLEHFDGKTWSVSAKRKQAENQLAVMDKPTPLTVTANRYLEAPIPYQLIVEPTQQPWLFTLAPSLPDNTLNGISVESLFDYTLRASRPVSSKKAFYFRYLPTASISNGIGNFEKQLNLQLSTNGNVKTREWAQSLAAQYNNERAIAQAVMREFSNKGFRYTLSPNAMPTNPIDSFLFEERAGFCAHYAGAMVYALRAAGVPARMVTGYQGGSELSDNVLQIRQYDAHAWVEVLIEDKWERYDPTSMVAPSRLTYGLETALEEFGESREVSILGEFGNTALFTTLQTWFQQLDYSWSKWVLGFDNAAQTNMLEDIVGALTPDKLRIVYLTAIGIVVVVLTLYFLPNRNKPRLSPSHRILFNAIALIEKKTGKKRENKSLVTYQSDVAPRLYLEAASAFKEICYRFEKIHYAAQSENTRAQRGTESAQSDNTTAQSGQKSPQSENKREVQLMKQQLALLRKSLKR